MKMSLQFMGAFTKPACIAGVRVSRPNRQRPVRPDDIVRAAQEVDVPVELVAPRAWQGERRRKGRRALANRAGETLDERGVQGLGILRLPQRSLQPTRRTDPPAPFDSADAIVPPSLEHVTRDARRPPERRSLTPPSYSNPSVAISGNPPTRPRRMTSLRTAVAFREARRPSTRPAHTREHTSMAAHHPGGLCSWCR